MSTTKATKPASSGWNEIRHLACFFLTWKAIIVFIGSASPGVGYDTSTEILIDQYSSARKDSWLSHGIEHVVLRLTRWDGIYFSTLSTRGHVNEQEWAFSWALARFTSVVARVFLWPLSLSPIVKHALSGIIISHLFHFVAVIALYHLTFQLLPESAKRQGIAFTAACLHVVSPAGIFLSAPFGESTFAALNFTGMLAWVLAVRSRFRGNHPQGPPATLSELSITVASGFLFGVATMVRSNGLLSGIILAWDAIDIGLPPLGLLHDINQLKRFVAIIAAGILVAVGFGIPQVVAYLNYCTAGNSRPWCSKMPPSIYSWVQEHYWEVGFLRYWTLNNLPLFIISGPVLAILILSATFALWRPQQIVAALSPARSQDNATDAPGNDVKAFKYMLSRLALPQLVLAVTASTSFHVQIINRISSGYAVWYIAIAIAIHASSSGMIKRSYQQWVVRLMAMYSIVQGGLYASFLPPA